MTRRNGTKLRTRLLKHLRIGLSVLALMLIPASVHGAGAAGTVLAEVTHAGEMARSEIVDTLHMIDAQFALSEPVYRGTDGAPRSSFSL
jgi:hypothetical protein